MSYHVYIVECSDTSLYTGSTNNIDKRIHSHNFSKVGAKYTKSRRPVNLRHLETFESKNEALKRECELKKFTRKQKNELITIQDQKVL